MHKYIYKKEYMFFEVIFNL